MLSFGTASTDDEISTLSSVHVHHLLHRVCRTAGDREDKNTAYSWATE